MSFFQNRQEARMYMLELELIQAYHTISFMHDCLMGKNSSYDYPDQTTNRLANIEKMVKIPDGCGHSGTEKGCKSCKDRNIMFRKIAEAKKMLKSIPRRSKCKA